MTSFHAEPNADPDPAAPRLALGGDPARVRIFRPSSWREAGRIAAILRRETVGGMLLLAAAVVALGWANSPWRESYHALRDWQFGADAAFLGIDWHLKLRLGQWASDGLLAVFFFVAGLELKREFVAGDLRDPRTAVLPVVAAVGGMVLPAVVFATVVGGMGGTGTVFRGWAIPTATDIAFALAVLAIISTHLPTALRTFLLTLAVVDDLLAIVVIAVVYTATVQWLPAVMAVAGLAVFTLLLRRGVRAWWVLLPLATAVWIFVHQTGIHATVAGVLLAFAVPMRRDATILAERYEHLWRPISAGVAVPLFALFAAGVTLGGWDGVSAALADPITLGVIIGLVAGKTLGITGCAWLVARFSRAQLDESLSWWDVWGVAMLGGVGFTVSLLIGELAYGAGSPRTDHATVGVLAGSLLAALLAGLVMSRRNRFYRLASPQ